MRALKLGQNDIVIAGGSEAAITHLNIYGFHVLKVLSTTNNPTKACRPFDKDRNGFVMSEGAGILVLEDFENARKRKAKIYGEIIGCAETGDAHHITEPNIKGATSCMRLALKDAGISPKGINLVNSHATSTLKGDLNEAKAIMEVFGQNGSGPFITANKSQIGHTLGAAGAIEAVISMLSIKNDIVPPVLNLKHPIKDCKTFYSSFNVTRTRKQKTIFYQINVI